MTQICRKKTFSHKVRSRCDSCKKRHLKCGEEKPVCIRCQKGGFECKYNAPKARLFELVLNKDSEELVPIPTRLYNRCDNDGFSFITPPVSSQWGTAHELRALEYWITRTGPWLGNYVPRTHHALWIEVLPRCAQLLPASRNLLIAVAMIDQRAHLIDPPEMMVRGRKIIDHYNKAIRVLTSPEYEPLDLYLAPLLAWMVETMLNNPPTAIMHLDASRATLLKVPMPQHTPPTETQSIVQNFLKDTATFCAGFTSTSAACAGVMGRTPVTVFQALRNNHSVDITSRDVRQAIYKYAATMDSEGHTSFAPDEALDYLRYWESSMLMRRHSEHEANATLVAAHFLIATCTTLLARKHVERRDNPFYAQKTAFDYLLLQFADLLDREVVPSREDWQGVQDATAFAMGLIMRFAKDEEHRTRAFEILLRTSPSVETGLSCNHDGESSMWSSPGGSSGPVTEEMTPSINLYGESFGKRDDEVDAAKVLTPDDLRAQQWPERRVVTP